MLDTTESFACFLSLQAWSLAQVFLLGLGVRQVLVLNCDPGKNSCTSLSSMVSGGPRFSVSLSPFPIMV